MQRGSATATSNGDNDRRVSEGLRAEYQDAIRVNAAAKRRYDEVAAQTLCLPLVIGPRRETVTILDQYLAILQQQKQHANLVEWIDQLNAIKVPPNLTPVNSQVTTQEYRTDTVPSQNGSALADSLSQSIHALELAVVQAHHQARTEKALLEHAKAASTDTSEEMKGRRLYAMLVVRKELTAWLEQSLDKCQDGNGTSAADEAEPAENDDIDWKAKIDHQYEQYLAARRRLLNAVNDLRIPQLGRDSKGSGEEEPEKQGPSLPRETGIMNSIEKTLLPRMEQATSLQAYSEFSDGQLQTEVTATTNMIARLSDESQLLQAFPILTYSGGFEKAMSTFGNKRQLDDTVTDGVSSELEPWLFAAEAADVASTGMTEKHLRHAEQAMDTVLRSASELRFLQEMPP